ncbi:unannotated protein [freshwater metagenome]|uniref:Unannotated protein n=1 Tax=freshwater metagenome TaxID=449393 RepID=A0A6J6UWS5_9ZZZZ|nr:TIGR03089 family protein [Actinomycetota bacterium]
MTTFADLLQTQLRRDPGRPFVTFYDVATGERTELSLTTYANWVAKAANLLVEELDLEQDDVLLLDLPSHWLGPVFLGAAWTVGLEVAYAGEDATPDAVVCGPQGLASWAPRADEVAVVASALHPLGLRFPDGVPPGVHDLGVEIWSQPDAFLGLAAVGPSEPDWEAAASGSLLTEGGRLLSTANPASPPGLPVLTEPLARGGSLVLVVGADETRLESVATDERVTARHHP